MLALFLAIAISATSVAWDFCNTKAAESGGIGSSTIPSTSTYKGIKYNFDDVDVTTLTDFTSTRLDNGNGNAQVTGQVDRPVSEHWFSGMTNPDGKSTTIKGIKPKTHRTNDIPD